MPTKSAAPAEAVHKVDDNPYGFFVNFSCDSASLILDVPPPRPPTPPPAPKGGKRTPPLPDAPPFNPDAPVLPPPTFISISYPGEFSPVKGSYTQVEGGEGNARPGGPTPPLMYKYSFAQGFRTGSDEEALNELINMKVVLQLHDAKDNRVLGTVAVDLLPFALGETVIELGDLVLSPTEVVGEQTKLLSGTLAAVMVKLQQRREDGPVTAPQPVEAEEGAGEEAGDEVEKPPLLPDLEPFSFLSESDAAGANVMCLEVSSLDPLPAGLQTAADVAGKDKTGGKITYNIGLKLGADGPAVIISTTLQSGELSFERRRKCINAADISALQAHLDDGLALAVEINRLVSNEAFIDNGAEAFRALAVLPGAASLLEAGCAELKAEEPIPLVALNEEEMAKQGLKSCLPAYEAPTGKPKPLEATTYEPGTCVWESTNSSLTVALTFARPVVNPWEPPTRPPHSLTDIIPTRDLNPPPPPPSADEEFREQIRGIMKALAGAYAAEPPPQPDTATQPPAQRHRRLIFELNRTGQYDELRNALKGPLVRIVKDRMGKTGSMNPIEMLPMYNELYSHLMSLSHMEMDSLCNVVPKPVPQPVPSTEQLTTLLALAREYELQGVWERAEHLHQRRLLDKDNAQVWYDHATFKVRASAAAAAAAANTGTLAVAPPTDSEDANLACAASSLKETLAIDPNHSAALEAMALVSLQQYLNCIASVGACCTAPEGDTAEVSLGPAPEESAEGVASKGFLESSIASAYALVDLSEGSIRAWALLAMAFGCEGKGNDWAMCQQEVQRLERTALNESQSPAQANPYFQIWLYVLQVLQLRDIATMAQQSVPSLRRSHRGLASGTELDVATARTLLLPGRITPRSPSSASAPAGPASPGASAAADPGERPEASAEPAQQPKLAGGDERQATGAEAGREEEVPEQQDAAAPTSPSSSSSKGSASSSSGSSSSGSSSSTDPKVSTKVELDKLLKKIRRECEDEGDVSPLLLKAEAQWLAGGSSALQAAVMTYQDALEVNPAACGLMTHLRLAEAYMKRGEPQYALDVCTAAVELTPCLSVWLAAARAYMALGDPAGARLALLEANLCDPENAESWGQLALVAVRLGYTEDAKAALQQCSKVRLRDSKVYCDIAAEFSKVGNYHEAQHVLQIALDAGLSTQQIHTALGMALVLQKEGALAKEQLEAAAAHGVEEEDVEQVMKLNKLALQIEALPLPAPMAASE